MAQVNAWAIVYLLGFLKNSVVKLGIMMHRLRSILTNVGPTRGFIFLLSLGLWAWGIFVINPFVDTFATAPMYEELAQIASEAVWGFLFMAAGFCMGLGAQLRNVDIIGIGAMCGFVLWTTVAIAYAMHDPGLTPVITNSVLALAHAWGWLSVRIQPRAIIERVEWSEKEFQDLRDILRKDIDRY